MNNVILVNKICNSCLTEEDGLILKKEIKKFFDKNEVIYLDFIDINNFVTLFFNNSISYFILNYSPESFSKLIHIKNLSDIGQIIYKFSVENAIKKYNEKLSKETEEKINKLTERNIDEL